MNIGNEIMARADELGELLCREEGKPRAEGRGEVYRAGQHFTYYAAEILRQLGENADRAPRRRGGYQPRTRRRVASSAPGISRATRWKIAPALAYGNAVIWKPANRDPARPMP